MTIATYIKEDLAARLTTGQDLPAQLTLDALSAHYKVSSKPVRTAVDELIAEGLIEKGANRRLVANGQRNGERSQKKTPKLPELPCDPFKIIADDLVQLSLKGEPVHLREEATAEKYGISRSAIRNILHRLAGSGMLDHIPRRGWRLRPFRQKDLQAFLEVRESLELKALELARPYLVDEDLRAILDGNAIPPSKDDPPTVDDSFHAYIIEKSGNVYIKEFFSRHGPYYNILFSWEGRDRQATVETIRQHRDILSALLRKDWRTARKALSHHIRCNHPVLNKIVPNVEGADRNRGRETERS